MELFFSVVWVLAVPLVLFFSVIWVLDVVALVPAGDGGALLVSNGVAAVVAARAGGLDGVDLPPLAALVVGAALAAVPLVGATVAVSGPADVFDGLGILAGSCGPVAGALNAVPPEDAALVFGVVSVLPVLLSVVERPSASDVLGGFEPVCACDPGGPAERTIGCHCGPNVIARAARSGSVLRINQFGQRGASVTLLSMGNASGRQLSVRRTGPLYSLPPLADTVVPPERGRSWCCCCCGQRPARSAQCSRRW